MCNILLILIYWHIVTFTLHFTPYDVCVKFEFSVFVLPQVIAESRHGDDQQSLEELQQQNLLQTLPSGPSSPRSRNRWSQPRYQAVLPPPEPEEESEPFILDLRNFPELANADMSSQNPNIQVDMYHLEQV